MPRLARVVIAGIPYHITQRGNRREKVFFSEHHYQQYLDWLEEYCQTARLDIYAYCLMSNHIHLVVVPQEAKALVQVFKPLHMRYAQLINRERRWTGHLWQGRFFSCPLDESYLWTAIKYVESNPVRAKLVKYAEEYKWSSALTHCNNQTASLLSPDFPVADAPANWTEWLREKEDVQEIGLLRRNTEKGLPCGSEKFIKKISKLIKRI